MVCNTVKYRISCINHSSTILLIRVPPSLDHCPMSLPYPIALPVLPSPKISFQLKTNLSFCYLWTFVILLLCFFMSCIWERSFYSVPLLEDKNLIIFIYLEQYMTANTTNCVEYHKQRLTFSIFVPAENFCIVSALYNFQGFSRLYL